MKLLIALAILLAAGPSVALNIIVKEGPATAEDEAPAKAPAGNLRPTQVLRCVDAKGKLVLQDVPCTPVAPVPAVAAIAASAAPEVIDLSSLSPRPAAPSVARVSPQEPEMGIYTKGLLNGAWKLGLLGLACYGLWRVARATRDRYREKYTHTETRSHRPRRVM